MSIEPENVKPATADPYTPGWEQFYAAWAGYYYVEED